MLEIWGRRNSSNVASVMWAVGELGLDHARHDVGGSFGQTGTGDYLKMNPNGLVPTIRDGELVLWESNAIVRYLCARYGAGSLYPGAPEQRALADQWMDWSKSTLIPAFFPIFWQQIRVERDKRDLVLVRNAEAATAEALGILEAHLADRAFVAGEALSMGDMPFGSMLYRYYTMPLDRPSLPQVERYYDGLCRRPAFQRHVMIPFGTSLEEWNRLEREPVD